MDCWITTHWPVPVTRPPFSRHVYLKARRRSIPKAEDIVLVYEAESATVNGKQKRDAVFCFQQRRERLKLPKGKGAIIGKMTVAGINRSINSDDAVFEFDNLRDWQLLECSGWTPLGQLPRGDLMEILQKPRKTVPRFLGLWRVPQKFVPRILMILGA